MCETKVRKIGKNIINYDTNKFRRCSKHGLMPIDQFRMSYSVVKNKKTGLPYNNGKKYQHFNCIKCHVENFSKRYYADPKGNCERSMVWARAHKERMRVVNKNSYDKHQKETLSKLKEKREETRLACLKAYSPELVCVLCGENHYEFLVLDHMNGGGNQQRKGIGSGTNHYKWVKRHGFPPGYRVLCHNCNQKEALRLKINNPVNGQSTLYLRNKEYFSRIRKGCLEHYSNGEMKCACCGCNDIDVLVIDHVEGGGNKHRKEIKSKSGHDIFIWLKKNNYPKGFRVLCFNCNFCKGIHGYCPHKQ